MSFKKKLIEVELQQAANIVMAWENRFDMASGRRSVRSVG